MSPECQGKEFWGSQEAKDPSAWQLKQHVLSPGMSSGQSSALGLQLRAVIPFLWAGAPLAHLEQGVSSLQSCIDMTQMFEEMGTVLRPNTSFPTASVTALLVFWTLAVLFTAVRRIEHGTDSSDGWTSPRCLCKRRN